MTVFSLQIASPLQFLGLGGWEWIIIVALILLLFGSRKIPDLARSLGRARGEFERGKKDVDEELKRPAPADDERERVLKAARELGILTEGKSVDQIREEIQKALYK